MPSEQKPVSLTDVGHRVEVLERELADAKSQMARLIQALLVSPSLPKIQEAVAQVQAGKWPTT